MTPREGRVGAVDSGPEAVPPARVISKNVLERRTVPASVRLYTGAPRATLEAMRNVSSLILCMTLTGATLLAQSPASRTVQAVGNATILVNPDQAQLDVGVVTSAATAQDAEQQNAGLSTTVHSALKTVLSSSGSFQTVGYSVSPRYSNTPGQASTIVGYTASNTVRVTTTDLTIIGRLIDAANQAGANSVGGLNFGLQDPQPTLQRALSQAAKQALANANAIAAGLGAKTGLVLAAQQGSSYVPLAVAGAGLTATTTPVQTGTVSVSATVTVNLLLMDQ